MRRSSATHPTATGFSRRRAQVTTSSDERSNPSSSTLGRVDEFLDASTMQGVAHAIVLDSRSSLIGCQVGAYEVVAHIGAGGMGEVYRARDTKLQRDVALKVLPDVFVNDPERLARFQREALVLASLNHPHIAAIYGLEESNDVRALVLELVEGPTLADRIAQAPIPLDEACSIATQIAAALEAAHRRRNRTSRSQTG